VAVNIPGRLFKQAMVACEIVRARKPAGPHTT
jgi:hypothetical protein